jgi:HTH-type transcriptional regulator/antitoxin HigA
VDKKPASLEGDDLMMNIKLIKNKNDYHKALKRIERLMNAPKGTPEYEELGILSIIVEDYENGHFPIEAPDPIEVIKFYMEQNDLKNRDLIDVIGSKGHVSDVLNKKRPLTLDMIRAISAKFSIPAQILIKEYPTDKIKNHSIRKSHHRVAAAEC